MEATRSRRLLELLEHPVLVYLVAAILDVDAEGGAGVGEDDVGDCGDQRGLLPPLLQVHQEQLRTTLHCDRKKIINNSRYNAFTISSLITALMPTRNTPTDV